MGRLFFSVSPNIYVELQYNKTPVIRVTGGVSYLFLLFGLFETFTRFSLHVRIFYSVSTSIGTNAFLLLKFSGKSQSSSLGIAACGFGGWISLTVGGAETTGAELCGVCVAVGFGCVAVAAGTFFAASAAFFKESAFMTSETGLASAGMACCGVVVCAVVGCVALGVFPVLGAP